MDFRNVKSVEELVTKVSNMDILGDTLTEIYQEVSLVIMHNQKYSQKAGKESYETIMLIYNLMKNNIEQIKDALFEIKNPGMERKPVPMEMY